MGTTVKIGKFLQNLPIRRQAVEKISVKMLIQIKRTLQAYALARPHLRLSLKILKAKDRKGDWIYPKSGALSASRLEASFNAAADIFGKNLTSQCDLKSSSWSSTGQQFDEATTEPIAGRDEVYTLEATMAKSDCGTFFLTPLASTKKPTNVFAIRWFSIVKCRPLSISGLEAGVRHKRNFEADHLILQIPLAFCYYQGR